ncbi:hypothetical protein [Alteribacter aurantiacus]|uniref:hypothetical protein n=1 Tax=Alteribacter aurantiacus TaxID=254410 RepID=UPI00040EB85C|nr:hypothetical protein [Alteribacter aurantiacus]
MRKLVSVSCVAVLLLAACGESEEEATTSKEEDVSVEEADNSTGGSSSGLDSVTETAEDSNEENNEEEAEPASEETGDEPADTIEDGSEEDNGFERYEYEGAYPGLGIEVRSDEEALESDLEAFGEASSSESGQDFLFYLRSVDNAINVRHTVEYHYNRYVRNVPSMIRNMQRVKLETDELDFARQEYLKAMEIHMDAVESLEPNLQAIDNEEEDSHVLEDFYTKIDEGLHHYALFLVQIVKIAEDTDLIDVQDMHDYEDMIAETLKEDEL